MAETLVMSGNFQNYISDGYSYVRHKMFSYINTGFLLTKIISNSDQQNMGGSNVMAIKLWKIYAQSLSGPMHLHKI